MLEGVVVTRTFTEPACIGARTDSFRPLLNRVARRLAGRSKRAPVTVEIYHGVAALATLATAQVVEVAFPGSALALELLEANPNACIIRLHILPSGEESDSPFEAFYEKAVLELAGTQAQHVEWKPA